MDILAIGDTAIDDFIKLNDATETCDINHEHCMLGVRLGDKVPYEFNTVVPGVGNSANAAVSAARLGLKACARLYVGEDDRGALCIDALEKNGVDTTYVEKEAGKSTNYHYVLWHGSERTILVKHESFTYTMPDLATPPLWIYLSSLSENSLAYHQEIAAYIARTTPTKVKLAFQPGTFQMKLGVEPLTTIYEQTEIFFCNKEESQRILGTEEGDIKKLLEGLHALGPKHVVITDGREGSYAREENGRMWHAPMYPDPKPPVERTGAGDATSSTTVAYVIKGLSLEEALLRGQINSMSVVQEIGAQKGLLTHAQIEEWYAKRPAEYKATDL